jgi:hypothetical protein
MKKIRFRLACMVFVAALGVASMPAVIHADDVPQSGGDGEKKPRCNPICSTQPPITSESAASTTQGPGFVEDVICDLLAALPLLL